MSKFFIKAVEHFNAVIAPASSALDAIRLPIHTDANWVVIDSNNNIVSPAIGDKHAVPSPYTPRIRGNQGVSYSDSKGQGPDLVLYIAPKGVTIFHIPLNMAVPTTAYRWVAGLGLITAAVDEALLGSLSNYIERELENSRSRSGRSGRRSQTSFTNGSIGTHRIDFSRSLPAFQSVVSQHIWPYGAIKPFILSTLLKDITIAGTINRRVDISLNGKVVTSNELPYFQGGMATIFGSLTVEPLADLEAVSWIHGFAAAGQILAVPLYTYACIIDGQDGEDKEIITGLPSLVDIDNAGTWYQAIRNLTIPDYQLAGITLVYLSSHHDGNAYVANLYSYLDFSNPYISAAITYVDNVDTLPQGHADLIVLKNDKMPINLEISDDILPHLRTVLETADPELLAKVDEATDAVDDSDDIPYAIKDTLVEHYGENVLKASHVWMVKSTDILLHPFIVAEQ